MTHGAPFIGDRGECVNYSVARIFFWSLPLDLLVNLSGLIDQCGPKMCSSEVSGKNEI